MGTEFENIRELFPAGTKIINFTGSPDKYTALLRSRCKSKEEFRQNWLKQYEKLSRVTMRVLLTRPKTGKTVVYKAAFRCQHNTYPTSHQRVRAPHRKHTGCPAILKVTIKASPENRRVRSMDNLRGEYPTIINVTHEHNHLLPNKMNFSYENCKKFGKTEARLSEISYENFTDSWVGSEFKKNEKLGIEEPDWDFLKECWSLFLERCESTNSVHLYRVLLKATNCLENCKTVNSIIAALNSIGQKENKQKCEAKVLVHSGSVSKRNRLQNGINRSNDTLSIVEVSNVVDELLVIDQGWII